jgi:hypothetical protein
MTLQKAVDIFNRLLDKFGSPNVIDAEIIDYINLGINEQLNRLFPDSQGGVVNFEFDSNTVANIQPLIYTLTGISMNGSGIVTNTTLNTALSTATGASDTYFRIGSIGLTNASNNYPVKYLKQNNRWSFERNSFKKPSVTKPRFTLIASGLQFFPISTSTPLTINVIKKPKVLTSSDLASDMEFSDYNCYSIIALALKAAGIAVRDDQMLEDVRMTALQIAQ